MISLQSFLIYLLSDLLMIFVHGTIYMKTLTLRKNGVFCLIGISLTSILCSISFYSYYGGYTSYINFIFVVIMCFTLFRERFHLKLLMLLIISTIQYMIEVTTLVTMSILNNSPYKDFFSEHGDYFTLLTIFIFVLLIATLLALTKQGKFPRNIPMNNLKKGHVVILTILMIFVFFYSAVIGILLDINARVALNLPTAFLLLTLFMVIAIIIGVINYINKLHANQQLELNNNLISQQLVYQLKHYQQLEHSISETRKVKHDMNNHLLCLSHLVESEQYNKLKDYLHDVKAAINEIESSIDTGNSMIDAIINEKRSLYKSEKIDFHFHGSFHSIVGIKPMDLCTIIANSLDNAYEANLKISSSTPRFIEMSCQLKQNHMVYKLVNSTLSLDHNKDGSLPTSKDNKEWHGFGLNNIKEAVARNNGDCTFYFNEDNFILEIIIPIDASV